jgi:hypothetical protein
MDARFNLFQTMADAKRKLMDHLVTGRRRDCASFGRNLQSSKRLSNCASAPPEAFDMDGLSLIFGTIEGSKNWYPSQPQHQQGHPPKI